VSRENRNKWLCGYVSRSRDAARGDQSNVFQIFTVLWSLASVLPSGAKATSLNVLPPNHD